MFGWEKGILYVISGLSLEFQLFDIKGKVPAVLTIDVGEGGTCFVYKRC